MRPLTAPRAVESRNIDNNVAKRAISQAPVCCLYNACSLVLAAAYYQSFATIAADTAQAALYSTMANLYLTQSLP